MTDSVRLPHKWAPRDYQTAPWNYLTGGGKRLVACEHRRWGKDDLALHWTACSAFQRPATLWHMLPQANQARRAIWHAVNPHTGARRIDEAFPHALRRRTNDSEMYIEFVNGSFWHVVGSDNYDRLVGSPPAGIVFSEWSLADPTSWARLEPILVENDGWAVFIYTSRGKNHGASLFNLATRREEWMAHKSTAEETDVFTPQQLTEIKENLSELFGEEEGDALFQQEYMSSFDSAVAGAFYSSQLVRAEREGRITYVPHEPSIPCFSVWDLGIRDSMAIWVWQEMGRELRCIDYIEDSGKGMDHYIRLLQRKPYSWSEHWAPHDIKVRELGSGKTRLEVAGDLGMPFNQVPNIPIIDGINAARSVFPRVWFDKEKCARGLDCLFNYKKQWIEKEQRYGQDPVKDWSNHGADAFRYLTLTQDAWQDEVTNRGAVIETSLGNDIYIGPGGRQVQVETTMGE